ncbi:hypothetical protein RND71_040693 [Anisodus tanguticus]|uniref:Uncharacterized protein n=1 Tax=Anisodus tanguticus TaxID=243964 RepID=A0AAE1QTH4_9SOLA|nr:hypothetical protein RND71_040693 [Anisodus tanguticus]
MSQFVEGGYEHFSKLPDCLGSDLALIEPNSSMAEDESRTGSINETGSSSKDTNNINNVRENAKHKVVEDEEEKGWLQLSIGGHTYMPTNNKPVGNSGRSGGLVELDLLPAAGVISTSSGLGANSPTVHTFPHHNIHEFRAPPPRTQQLMMTPTSSSTSLFLQQYPGAAGTSSTMFPQQEIINWGFRPMQQSIQQNINLSLVSDGSHFGPGPFPVLGGPGPSSIDFRVIHPPRRPHSGLWFSLQPSLNQ